MRLSLLAAAVLAVAAAAAHADPVTYTLSGTFSGTLNGINFTDAAGSFTFQGDTSGTTSLGAGFYTNTTGISTFQLAGVGTSIILSPTFGVESQFDGAGFYDTSNGFGASIYDPALGYYALTYPFSDTAFLTLSFATLLGTPELTSLGELQLTGDYGSSATFTAVGATPEPGSIALLGTGLFGMGALVRRRGARRA